MRKLRWPIYTVALCLHTVLVYGCALRLSPWMVFHWFRWTAFARQTVSNVSAGNWYLQHLEMVTIASALVVGYVNVFRFLPVTVRSLLLNIRSDFVAIFAWAIPTLFLIYKMTTYDSPSSVLDPNSMTAFRYFFYIQTIMPTVQAPLASDPVRVLAQIEAAKALRFNTIRHR